MAAVLNWSSFANVDYTTNGSEWGKDPTAATCGAGKEQSPIDLFTQGATMNNLMQINGYGYENISNTTVTRNEHTIVVGVNNGEF